MSISPERDVPRVADQQPQNDSIALGSSAKPQLSVNRRLVGWFFSQFYARFASANAALRHPPEWTDIEELESNWGVDADNRNNVLAALKRFICGLSFLLVLVLLEMFTMHSDSAWILLASFVICFVTIVTLLVLISTSIWRLYVLEHREPLNYVDWLRGRSN